MKNIIDYYENAEKTEIDLSAYGSRFFDYVSETSIHSEVTDWAYGVPLKRPCVDISDGKPLIGTAEIADENRRFFLKIIACMPKWKKCVNSLTVTVNGKTVYSKPDAFFEQVNLGWPALYIEIEENALKKGKNLISVSTTDLSGGGLYVSELSLISFTKAENLSQVSAVRYVKAGDIFGVAVLDKNRSFEKTVNAAGCEYLKHGYYKDYCVITFTAKTAGDLSATALFGGRKKELIMPKAVDNSEAFYFGSDSDDHRQDDSDETAFIIETLAFTGMGNFLQFRPHRTRNFYKLADESAFKNYIGLTSAFGMKYGLADSDGDAGFLPLIDPQHFYGYHIHEPYLFFNPALLENPYEKDWFLCDPASVEGSRSFGESKALYMDVLRRSKEKFAKDIGQTSFGSPSLLCVYEGDAGVDRLTVEPVSNVNLLVGAVRASSAKIWGAHIPTDWYFGVPVDRVKSNKYRLAMQYLYVNGASYVYSENSLFKTNAFARCDWESDFCKTNRKYLREFYDYALTHERKGRLIVKKAIIYGRNEFFMWKINDRIAELKEKDWDSYVWGKWDNAYHVAWNASEAWLPVSDRQNEYKSPLNKDLFSGTPYGNVDIVGAEKDFSAYSEIAFLGWNTMNDELLTRLLAYVKNGGTLMISYAQFNYTDRNDMPPVFPESDRLKDLLGVDITGETEVCGRVDFADGGVEISGVKAVKCLPITATVLARDKNGNGVVYKNVFGKGCVYFIAFKEYITKESDAELYKKVLRAVGDAGAERCDNPNVSYAVRETENEYRVSVLNMNCIEGADEKFKIEYNGKTIADTVSVGEIREYVIKKR